MTKLGMQGHNETLSHLRHLGLQLPDYNYSPVWRGKIDDTLSGLHTTESKYISTTNAVHIRNQEVAHSRSSGTSVCPS